MTSSTDREVNGSSGLLASFSCIATPGNHITWPGFLCGSSPWSISNYKQANTITKLACRSREMITSLLASNIQRLSIKPTTLLHANRLFTTSSYRMSEKYNVKPGGSGGMSGVTPTPANSRVGADKPKALDAEGAVGKQFTGEPLFELELVLMRRSSFAATWLTLARRGRSHWRYSAESGRSFRQGGGYRQAVHNRGKHRRDGAG